MKNPGPPGLSDERRQRKGREKAGLCLTYRACGLAVTGRAWYTVGEMVHFRLFGIPVVIHPSMWVILAVLAVLCVGDPLQAPLAVLLFMMAGFLTLLAHEMGHAVVGRYLLKGETNVYLAWLGGECFYEGPTPGRGESLLLTVAGPLGSLALAPVVLLVMNLYLPSTADVLPAAWDMVCWTMPREMLQAMPVYGAMLLLFLLQLSVWWSVLNLLPVYPLDGGRVLAHFMGSRRRMHTASMVIAAVLSLAAFSMGMVLLGSMLIFLVVANYNAREGADD